MTDLAVSTVPLPRTRAVRATVVAVVAVACLYAAGSELAFWMERNAATGVAFFAPAGITLAALALSPRTRWPWLLAAVAIVEAVVDLRHGQSLGMAIGFAAANTIEPFVGASLLVRKHRRDATPRTRVAFYVLFAVVLGPVAGAAVGGTVAALSGLPSPVTIATRWWIGDALGVLVVGTTVLAWAEQLRFRVDPVISMVEVVGLTLLAGAVTLVTMLVWNEPVVYIVLPILMWAALRGGFSAMTAAATGVALVANVAVAHGDGGHTFAYNHTTSSELLYVQLFLAVAFLTGLLLAVEVVERLRAQRALRQTEAARLEARLDGLDAAAVERRRIAREVHDIVGHALNVVVLQAGGARRVLNDDHARARDLIESVERTGRDAFRDLDAALGLVERSPDLAPGRGLADVDELATSLRQAGLAVELAIDGEPCSVPRLVDWSAFRILQEALTNVVKHSEATSARVAIDYEPDGLAIEVTDDGHVTPNGNGGGRGLIGMRERVSVLGGELSAGPGERGGFTVRARIPLDRVENQ